MVSSLSIIFTLLSDLFCFFSKRYMYVYMYMYIYNIYAARWHFNVSATFTSFLATPLFSPLSLPSYRLLPSHTLIRFLFLSLSLSYSLALCLFIQLLLLDSLHSRFPRVNWYYSLVYSFSLFFSLFLFHPVCRVAPLTINVPYSTAFVRERNSSALQKRRCRATPFDFGSPRPDINRKGKVFPCFVSSPLSRTEAIHEDVARKKRRKLSRKEAPREQMTATIFTKFSLYSFHIFLRLWGAGYSLSYVFTLYRMLFLLYCASWRTINGYRNIFLWNESLNIERK